jgi:hypothetical protein
MTFSALVDYFAKVEELPIPVDEVIDWIRNNTSHKNIKLHAVTRDHKVFRGAFRQTAMPSVRPYDTDPEVLNCILYGKDLEDDWKRLVIVKELTHLFDGPTNKVDTEAAVKALIPAVIEPELKGAPIFGPAFNDHFGVFRAMMLLMPVRARLKLKSAFEQETRTIDEIADYCKLPVKYVDIWIRFGDQISDLILNKKIM